MVARDPCVAIYCLDNTSERPRKIGKFPYTGDNLGVPLARQAVQPVTNKRANLTAAKRDDNVGVFEISERKSVFRSTTHNDTDVVDILGPWMPYV